ncbi:MAG TPA: hypothetical protein VNN07_10570, partial [Candidatus Tectomicrobia bacterium]|nr:hypothetical protein [Candidatus Tectomicrobia bacterium]
PRWLGAETRATLGSIGVVASSAPPAVRFAEPAALGGVGGGVKAGAAGLGLGVLGAAGCLVTMGYFVPACAVAVLTPYWVGRGVHDGVRDAVPDAERRASKAVLVAAADDTDHGTALLDAILEDAQRRGLRPPLQRLALPGPSTPQERPHYGEARSMHDTVLEVTLLRLGLDHARDPSPSNGFLEITSFTGVVDPWLAARVEARVRVLRPGGDVLLERTLHVTEGGGRFTEWARDDAAPFRQSVASAIEQVARTVVDLIETPPGSMPVAPDPCRSRLRPEEVTMPFSGEPAGPRLS